MSCQESISLPLNRLHMRNRRNFSPSVNIGIFRGGLAPRSRCLADHIAEYSRKKLSNSDDILNGMLGIFRAYERKSNSTHHYWGLPIEYKPENYGVEANKWPKDPEPSLAAGFARSLLWASDSPSIRRSGFPSWSWTGWLGCISSSAWHETYPSDLQLEVNFWIELQDGSIIVFENFYNGIKLRQTFSRFSYFLHIEAWTIQMRFEYKAEFFENELSEPCEPGYYTQFPGTEGTHWLERLELSQIVEEGSTLHDQLISTPLDGLVLQKIIDNKYGRESRLIVLVIRQDIEVAERIGRISFNFRNCVLDDGFIGEERDRRNRIPITRMTVRLG